MAPMRIMRGCVATALLAGLGLFPAPAAVHAGAQTSGASAAGTGHYFVYVGTYTHTIGKGIHSYRFDADTGQLTPTGLVTESSSPAFLVTHPNGRFLYAANEHNGEDTRGKNDTVSAFAIDRATGALTFLNKVSSRGEGPCYVSLDRGGRTLLVANYRSGSVAAMPILPDGRLGEASAFDQHPDPAPDAAGQPLRPHAHHASPSLDDRFAFSADPPLDRVMLYRFDPAKGALSPNNPPFVQMQKDLGPRRLVFHPGGKYAYVNAEKGSAVTVFAYQAAGGTLKELQTLSTLPPGFTGRNQTAEMQIDRAGRFLYVSNRGHDTIAIFSIDARHGTLTAVGHAPSGGRRPRYFALDPTGQFLLVANQDTHTVIVNRIDAKTGLLTPVQTMTEPTAEPVFIAFVPAT